MAKRVFTQTFGVVAGGMLFHEKGLARKMIASVLMVVGVILAII